LIHPRSQFEKIPAALKVLQVRENSVGNFLVLAREIREEGIISVNRLPGRVSNLEQQGGSLSLFHVGLLTCREKRVSGGNEAVSRSTKYCIAFENTSKGRG